MRVAVELLVWWAGLFVGYLVTLSAVSGAELAVGAAIAVVGAVCAFAGRRALTQRWTPDPRWLRWFALSVPAVLADVGRLATVAVPLLVRNRGNDGRLRRLEAPPREPPPRAAARRALGTTVLSVSPGSYVVDWPDDAPPVVHALVTGRPRLEREVVR